MNRIAAILLTGWVFVAAPALCLAGVLEHLCSRTECHHQERDSEPPSKGHECQNDPCDTPVIQPRPIQRPDECSGPGQPAVLTSTGSTILPAGEEPVALPATGVPPTYPPCYADRALPLLI